MRPISGSNEGYRKVLSDDESLKIFLGAMARFDSAFCEVMNGGRDYTLRLEIHGNSGKLIHCRLSNDNFDRPRNCKVKSMPSKEKPET